MVNEIQKTIADSEQIRKDLVHQRDVIQAAINNIDEANVALRAAYGNVRLV